MRKVILLFALLLFSVNAYTQPNVYGFDCSTVDIPVTKELGGIVTCIMYTPYMSFSIDGVIAAYYNWIEKEAILDYENIEKKSPMLIPNGVKKAMEVRKAEVGFILYEDELWIITYVADSWGWTNTQEYAFTIAPILQWRKK